MLVFTRALLLMSVFFAGVPLAAAEPASTPESRPTLSDGAGTGTATTAPTTQPPRLRDDVRYRRLWSTTFWSGAILVVFLVASITIVIFSRRFRQYLSGKKGAPTPIEDVWAMHKAPENTGDFLNEDDYEGFNKIDGGSGFLTAGDEDDGVDDEGPDEFNPDDDRPDEGFDPGDDDDDLGDADDTDGPKLN